jgi:hypothetical protein
MVAQQKKVGRGEADLLVMLRSLFVAFCLGLVLIGVAVMVLGLSGVSSTSALPAGVTAAVVGAWGAATWVCPRLIERPLLCASDDVLAGSYRTRFFLRLAFADSAALVAFVGFVLTGQPWMYLIGLLFAAIGFARLAPTARRLAEDQEHLSTAGCGRSLVAALRQRPDASG